MIIGSNIIFIENLPSTNIYASQILKASQPSEGTVIYTNYQSAGRGQKGNGWESEDGKNLLFSIILYPTILRTQEQFIISVSISLGLIDFLKQYIPYCCIKWPNDIYVNNDKIAGILIENSIMGDTLENSIAGIGLNVNQVKFVSNAPNPTSMKTITGHDYDLSTSLSKLTQNIDRRYKQLLADDYMKLMDEYTSYLFRFKEWCRFTDETGVFTGRILSVSNSGMLTVEKESGSINEYSFKEIEFIL